MSQNLSSAAVVIAGFPQALEIMENLKNLKKTSCMEKSWNFKKVINYGKIMEFCEII